MSSETEREELERERRECREVDPPMTGHHSYLTEKLRELDRDEEYERYHADEQDGAQT